MGFNVTSLLVDSFVDQLRKGYEKTYGHSNEHYKEIICWAAGMALDIIANSDALYHNVSRIVLIIEDTMSHLISMMEWCA